MSAGTPLRLHLGCGTRYFEGYRNIDFPPDEHGLAFEPVADELANLLDLRYPEGSVDEVRLHHVFEHFTRPVACALVASWHGWLRPGGTLRIEVPDFERTARAALRRRATPHERGVALRHIFGSNEAAWAVHYEGWTPGRLRGLLKAFGFEIAGVERGAYKGTHNIDVTARRTDAPLSAADLAARARAFLALHRVDDSPSELELLEVWMREFERQLERCAAQPAR